MTDLLEVGRIGRAHGVQGALHVVLSSDRTERLDPGARLFDGEQWLVVVTARTQPSAAAKVSKWVVQFEGLADRNAAERLTGRLLSAEPIADTEALWIHELIGASVVEAGGTDRGRCVAVLDNPAHDILELDSGALVPVTFVVSHIDGVITIDPPDGLFDLD